jgi:HrpA-like RNA helicase
LFAPRHGAEAQIPANEALSPIHCLAGNTKDFPKTRRKENPARFAYIAESMKEASKPTHPQDPLGFSRHDTSLQSPNTRGKKRARGGSTRGGSSQVSHESRGSSSPRQRGTPDSPSGHPSKRARQQADLRARQRSNLREQPHFEEEPDLPVPTEADYPTAPKGLFRDSHQSWNNITKSHLQTSEKVHRLNGKFAVQIDCNTFCELGNELVLTAVGFGSRQVGDCLAGLRLLRASTDNEQADAKREACKRVLGKLHHNGVLRSLYSEDTTESEPQAFADIYNYCARDLEVPTINIEYLDGLNRRNRMVRVTISVEEERIRVTAVRLNLEAARHAASVLFKRAAEKHHAQKGDRLVVKGQNSLTVGTAQEFFKYFNSQQSCSWDVRSEQEQTRHRGLNGGFPWRSQAYLRGEPIGDSVLTYGKKVQAEELAYLTGAVHLAKANLEIYQQFLGAKRSSTSRVLGQVRAVDLELSEEAEHIMRETAGDVFRSAPALLRAADVTDSLEGLEFRPRRHLRDAEPDEHRSKKLKAEQLKFGVDPATETLRKTKEKLPMNAREYRGKVLDLIDGSTYSIIVGATGSGKTTQVPQILLEDSIKKGEGASTNIICTQPRRIAATSVARRVAEERSERLQDTIGYHVRGDSKLPRQNGSVTYCTTGILLAQLQNSPDEILDTTSHIIIDEVHERDSIIDYLMITLKKLVAVRRQEGKFVPKVVLMSATLDTDLFAGYFAELKDGEVVPCPLLTVPGRTFPVKEKYLDEIMDELRTYDARYRQAVFSADRVTNDYLKSEDRFSANTTSEDNDIAGGPIDWNRKATAPSETSQEDGIVPVGLVAAAIAHIAKTTTEGAILAFLPGLEEITKTEELLNAKPLGVDFADPTAFKSYKLHSSIIQQEHVFAPVPPGCRKIILATNIAETSVTIPDVQYVVDTGKLKEKRYDQETRITQLVTTWVSKSNSRQRSGRAGRVQNGNYYALFSKARFGSLRAIGLPEILRSDLQEICLDIKAQAFKAPVREFLAAAIEPPAAAAVDASLEDLQALGAITEDEKLTPLGKVLASLPVHPSLSKMILMGILFRCFDAMLILGASSQSKDLFYRPMDSRKAADEARKIFAVDSNSDQIATINCFRIARELRAAEGSDAFYRFAQRYFMNVQTFLAIERTMQEIETILVKAKLIPHTFDRDRAKYQAGHPDLNRYSSSIPLMKMLILAGTYPNMGVGTSVKLLQTSSEIDTLIHPSSLNSDKDKGKDATLRGLLFAFSSLTKSADGNTLFLRDSTAITPLMAAMLSKDAKMDQKHLLLDGWLPVYIKREQGFHMRSTVQAVTDMRAAFGQVLEASFNRITHAGGRHLADDPVLERFVGGFVAALSREVSGGGGMVSERGASIGSSWRERGGPKFRYHGSGVVSGGGRRGFATWGPTPRVSFGVEFELYGRGFGGALGCR